MGSADHGLSIPCGDCWSWQIVPDGVLYPAYLAGLKESRIGAQPVYVRDHGWFWDSTLGGRAGLLRYGSENPCWPEGWQLDVEGAAFPRLDPEAKWELRSSDFRLGIPLTFRRGRWEGKFGYYHLCAHLGDFFVLEHLSYPRISYVRDAAVVAMGFRPCPDLRLYYEAAFAFHTDGEARPWEFQFGAEYSPVGPTGARGAPFVAVNTHLRQDNDFSGNVSLQTGWQWRGKSTHLMRVGLHYFNGLSEQYQFYANHEDQVGAGLWYDF